MENILDKNLAAVTLKQLRAGLAAYNKAKVGDRISMAKGAKKKDFAKALVNAVAAARDNGEFVRMPEQVKKLYNILANGGDAVTTTLAKGKARPVARSTDDGADVKPVARRKGGGYTGITRPDAFKHVLHGFAGKTVQRAQLNKAMQDAYGGSKDNATWWAGVYMQLLCSLGLAAEVERGKFAINLGVEAGV